MTKENWQSLMIGFFTAVLAVMMVFSLALAGLIGYRIGQQNPRPEEYPGPSPKSAPAYDAKSGKQVVGTLNTPEDLIPPTRHLSPEEEELENWLVSRFQRVHEKFKQQGMERLNSYEKVVWAVWATHAQLHYPEALEAEGDVIPEAFGAWTSWAPEVARQLGLSETEKLLDLPWKEFREIQPQVIARVIQELKEAGDSGKKEAKQVRYEA